LKDALSSFELLEGSPRSQASAWERNVFEALPHSSFPPFWERAMVHEAAEPPIQRVPRLEPGNEKNGYV
jgi:hypothetical protein